MSAGVYKTKDKAKPAASPEVGHSTPLHPPCSPRSAACSRSGESFTQVKVSSVPVKTKEGEEHLDLFPPRVAGGGGRGERGLGVSVAFKFI